MKVGKTNSYSCVVYTKSCVLKSLNDKFEICASKGRKIGVFFRFLAFGVISFEYRETWERYARHVSSLTNKENLKNEGKQVFFQVSWNRCHIVRIQGDWRKICQICVQLNKQTNKGEKIWNFCFGVISFEYRERKKERRNLVKTGGKLLTLTIFDLQLCSLQQKLRFEEPEWEIKWQHTKSKRRN